MKINSKYGDQRPIEPRRSELLNILNQPTASDLRPCSNCHELCSTHHSNNCTCDCKTDCPEAAKQLTSDPVRYPIESGVLALVYEFAALRVCQPCWSCEGHVDANDKLSKLPAVWFYVDDLTVVDMISSFLTSAQSRLKLSAAWHLAVSYGPDEVAFSCTPNAWLLGDETTLQDLQQDLIKLSAGLREGLHELVRREIAK